jgi:YD repeat-containing protein
VNWGEYLLSEVHTDADDVATGFTYGAFGRLTEVKRN